MAITKKAINIWPPTATTNLNQMQGALSPLSFVGPTSLMGWSLSYKESLNFNIQAHPGLVWILLITMHAKSPINHRPHLIRRGFHLRFLYLHCINNNDIIIIIRKQVFPCKLEKKKSISLQRPKIMNVENIVINCTS